ncbi:Rrf2 family transcriptional regulator [Caenispirillum bisanense]|uniref:Transcriptional regulator, BadM/Rrf2 family n=1 Tax=Caenispirillum bisanense TaxID=414052 RepID=A0A286G9T5_9PROT|nr:Rrf2 family transcriptional regulator [Caenispirillum bisanense]SOD92278.1 transcriptional regulator, BadM/Rrf2 family [Caenispirillum bisanense]
MRLTQHTDYALRLLITLALTARRAARDGGAAADTITIREVAERYGISRNHLMKVANDLTRAGVVEGLRGRGGGLRLAVPAAEINIGVLVRALEDGRDLVECFRPETNTCRIAPACRLKGVLRQAQEAFLAVLDGYTLADVVDRPDDLDALLQLAG